MQTIDISASSPSAEDSSSPQISQLSPSQEASSKATSSTNADPTSDNSTDGKKRKQTRRINTAERRASHNAVERQRRETLNGRFLDLAAMLPNLSQIRRPSKSAIVNSSIAYLHASRRHRLMASRELRLLKFEADALRRELNDWRDRASIRRVQEPTRSDGFSMVLSGEIEILSVDGIDDEDGEDDLYTPVIAPDDNFEHPFDAPFSPRNDMRPPPVPPYSGQHQMTGSGPMIASPTGMVMENPFAEIAYSANGISGSAINEMEQSMQHANDQTIFGSSGRRRSSSERDRSHESRKTAPKGAVSQPLQYLDPGWNTLHGANMNSNVVHNGVPFGMM